MLEDYIKDQDAILIDVRRPEEYAEGYLEDAINIPNECIEDIERIVQDKNRNIYLYCRTGNRSGQSLEKLKKLGYKNVYNIGGIEDYMK